MYPANELATLSLLLLGLLAVCAHWRDVRGTTLVAPWPWTIAAFVSLMAVEANVAGDATSHLQYAAAVTTLCPLMALLGAKRPQHRAWQLIVLTFLGVLLLPAGEALLFHPGGPLTLHAARRWFLLILIALGTFNSLPTRYWPTGLLTCVAQILLLNEFLPLLSANLGPWRITAGAGCLALAQVLRAAKLPPGRRADHPADRMWLDFRNSYGTLWALRVAERFNDSARRLKWGARLEWGGLVFDAGVEQPSAETQAAANRGLRTLLRRFVSAEWIARRR